LAFDLSSRKRVTHRMKILAFLVIALLLAVALAFVVDTFVIFALLSPIILAAAFIGMKR
jgi:hypothetical protein